MLWTRHLWLLVALWTAAGASAQVWMEIGDAPEGIPENQLTIGPGPLLEIQGSLDRPLGDHVDTYCIRVIDPLLFFASTAQHLGGDFPPTDLLADSRMWLWSQSQFDGIADIQLANDDDGFVNGDLASTISDPSTFTDLTMGAVDATALGIMVMANQPYLLSISTGPNDPEDVNNVALAPIDIPPFTPTSLFGPDPSAGPFDHWENEPSPDAGRYIIALRGVSPCLVPEPSSCLASALVLGWLFLVNWRRQSGVGILV